MWTDVEKQEAIEAFRRIEQEVIDLNNAVYGNDRDGRDGLIKDMKLVHAFILKWDKREYLVRWLAAVVGSNLLLTILGFLLTFFAGNDGGGG